MNGLQYYVYYQFEAGRLDEVRAAVDTLLSEIQSATGIQGTWQRRRDDPTTFMETYSAVIQTDDFNRALKLAIEKSGFSGLGIPRITEIFQCA